MLIPDFISHIAIVIIFCCGVLVCYKYSSFGSSSKKKFLPLDAQLKVLKNAKKIMKEAPYTYYLCGCICHSLEHYGFHRSDKDGIPVFCRKNAVLYGNAQYNHLYWWPLTLAGKEERLNFLDWCIGQVELQIKYETQRNKRFYRKWFK